MRPSGRMRSVAAQKCRPYICSAFRPYIFYYLHLKIKIREDLGTMWVIAICLSCLRDEAATRRPGTTQFLDKQTNPHHIQCTDCVQSTYDIIV